MTAVDVDEGVPFGTHLQRMADRLGEQVAVIFAAEDGSERSVSFRELDERSTQLAHVFAGRGLGVGDHLAVCLRNSPEHMMACFAGWKVGAVVIPVRWDLPEWERGRVLATLDARLTVDADHADLFDQSLSASTERLEEAVSPHGWGICSSGSTGTPKAIVMNAPGRYIPGSPSSSVVEEYGALERPQRVLIPAPLYHSNGFTAMRHVMGGDLVILLERFNAERILDLIERHQVTGFTAASPMLQRLAQVAGIDERDLSSLQWVLQGAAVLPVWLGQRWCELIGPEHFFLSYGASEGLGLVSCRGDGWLEHPGTLGRGIMGTEIKILDTDHRELPTGEVGGIYMRTPTGPAASYVGDNIPPMPRSEDGFVTVGDLGWLDDDGFVFMADRRSDMIVTGAVNVFPAEVEAALSEHPEIADVVVIGLRDPEWGRRVHAIVQPAEDADRLSSEDVIAFAKARLASYKVPKTVEFIELIPRSEAMKLSRATFVAEREGPEPAAETPSGVVSEAPAQP